MDANIKGAPRRIKSFAIFLEKYLTESLNLYFLEIKKYIKASIKGSRK